MSKTMFITSAGTTNYPHITAPDTEGQYATNKFSTKLIMSPEAAKPLIDLIQSVVSTHKAGKNCKLPYKPETRKDGDTAKPTGMLQFSLSSKYAPALMDSKNNPINLKKMGDDFFIGSGSKVKIAGEVYSYDKGVSLQMRQVQLLNLVNTAASMFEADEDGNFDGSDYEDDTSSPGAFTESNQESMGI